MNPTLPDPASSPQPLFTIDGEPEQFALADMRDANPADDELLAALRAMAVGETRCFGGGAWATFTMTRVE